MPIEVDLPDGGVAEFPDGTHPDVMKTALAKRFPAPASTASNVASAATDAAWQAPQGFNRGLDATINAPYNLIRAGAGLFGKELPEAQPIFGQFNSGVQPKGATGRIAGSVGEAVGSSVVPEAATLGLAARAAGPLAADAGTLATVGHNLLQGVRAAPGATVAADTASAVGSGLGTGTAKELGAGPIGQFAGGVVGGLAPAAGSIARSMMQLRPQQQMAQNALLDAGHAQDIPIPRAAAGGDVTQNVAGGLNVMPYIGTPIQQGFERSRQALDDRMLDIAGTLGSADRVTAGNTVGTALRNWIRGDSADINRDVYQAVDRHIPNPDATRPMTATQQAVADMQRRQGMSTSTAADPAIRLVQEAIARDGGLTYQAQKDLRTDIGARISGQITPEPGTSQPALKRLYSALSDDLRATVHEQGGQAGLDAFNRANTTAAAVARRRQELTRVIGLDANAPPEQVHDAILRLASNGAGGNLRRLVIARDAAGPAWDEMSSSAIARLGRDADGNFTGTRMVTAYGKLSNGGKRVLFGDVNNPNNVRQSLEHITTISRRFDQLGKLGNPSGTGRVNSLWHILDKVTTAASAAIGAVAAMHPAGAVAAAPGLAAIPAGRALSHYLGNPTTAHAVTAFSQAALNQVRNSSQATAAALQTSVRELARELAKADGSDPKGVEAAIRKALSGQNQGNTTP